MRSRQTGVDMAPAVRAAMFVFVLITVKSVAFIANCSSTSTDNSCASPIIKSQTFVHVIFSHGVRQFRRAHKFALPSSRSMTMALLLALAGDIEANPGPRKPRFPCGICSKAVRNTDSAVCCDECNLWVHNRCSGLSRPRIRIIWTNIWKTPVVESGYVLNVAFHHSRLPYSSRLKAMLLLPTVLVLSKLNRL